MKQAPLMIKIMLDPLTTLTYQNSKVLLENNEKPKIGLSKYRKIYAVLYNWKMAVRIEAGFSLNNKPKTAENTPG